MKKILLALLIAVSASFAAKPLILEICTPSFCYEQMYENVQKIEFLTASNGKKFVRIHYFNGKTEDINGDIKVKRR